jgi:GNAT superfamily N-acetyltransferase
MMKPPTGPNVDDYVEHFAFTSVLSDGTPVRLRPIAPKDRERLIEGWKNLSKQSRYLRFMRSKTTLSDRDLNYLTVIDYSNHFAWAAEALNSAHTPGVGIARYIRVADEPRVAEAAVAVVDELQGLGLGRLLLESLAGSARENGIDRFRAYVSTANRTVLDALSSIGANRVGVEDGMFILELPLPEAEFNLSPLYAALRTAAIDYAGSS